MKTLKEEMREAGMRRLAANHLYLKCMFTATVVVI